MSSFLYNSNLMNKFFLVLRYIWTAIPVSITARKQFDVSTSARDAATFSLEKDQLPYIRYTYLFGWYASIAMDIATR
ncbi:predicted protein [Pyrenophora tritici-repentis Pt-1C-BFP]|uniref:Uncharacterized protein n=1 Tax=Pyrenophora tritici-repentis (strain Pt-1C-BFP) TaxID=426418 RepID=B2VUF9_PYRTR|nr:uncharacterized protein PTRG_01015 [Pyrenophora tritici-repentis Pt-1C-BFP]EDU40453.1 predicted protein [Pyrenophora tritici-repentis Pt-1C-BFP]